MCLNFVDTLFTEVSITATAIALILLIDASNRLAFSAVSIRGNGHLVRVFLVSRIDAAWKAICERVCGFRPITYAKMIKFIALQQKTWLSCREVRRRTDSSNVGQNDDDDNHLPR